MEYAARRRDIQDVVCVKDRALDAFMRPFFVPSRNVAHRAFRDEINNPQGDMYRHPDDYDLYAIGLFDCEGGELVPMPLELIARGKDVVNPKEA